MEFDDMKRIWDSQNNEPLYAINERALHNRILSKKKKTLHITNFTELLAIIVNFGSAFFIVALNLYKQSTNVFMYLLPLWMFLTGVYSVVSRIRRINIINPFNNSMREDLNQAIAVAAYQVRFSFLMRWNMLPIGSLLLLGIWDAGKSLWLAIGMLAFFIMVGYAAGWEHNYYKSRKRELELLHTKLESEA